MPITDLRDGTRASVPAGAAFTASAELGRRLGPRDAAWWWTSLAGVSTLLGGWIAFDWSFQRLEWSFLYTFVSPQRAIELAGLLIPVILVRHLLPFFAFRLALRERLATVAVEPRPAIQSIQGARMLIIR